MNIQDIFRENEINIVKGKYEPVDICRKIVNNSPEIDDLFCVQDVSEIVRRFLRLKEIMPRVEQFYAMKCNSNKNILKAMAAVGCNFECATKDEIDQLLNLNIDQDRIIFANPVKPISHIEYVAQHQVLKMVFDSDAELHRIQSLFPNAELVLRFRCDAKEADFMLGEKYGCDSVLDAPRLISLAKDLRLNVIGVSFHVGCGCKEADVYRRAIKIGRELFDYGKKIGYTFKFLDLGGGFPGYSDSDISPFVNVINQALDTYFPEKNVRIISEFGQYYVTAGCTLVCVVLGKRQLKVDEDNSMKIMYYINDSVLKNFIISTCDVIVPLPRFLFSNSNTKLKIKSTIWGCTMENNDKIHDDVMLPEFNCGDYIVFDDMGAYSQSIESDFCGFSKTLVFTIVDEVTYSMIQNSDIFRNSKDLVEFTLN